MSLATLLPQPLHVQEEVVKHDRTKVMTGLDAPLPNADVPKYGTRERSDYIPKNATDFGDGGAFPEIHIMQYPLEMGKKGLKSATSTVTALQVDSDGKVKFDLILSQSHRKDKNLFSNFRDLIPKNLDADELAKPGLEEEVKIAEATRKALGMIVDKAASAAQPTHIPKTASREPVFIRYTPSQQSVEHNSGATQRIIRLQEMPVDPLEPPKFQHKRLPNGPPSPPVPVMHSPPRKVTVEDQQNWKVPPCISNWKNIKGYTIPLDKRLAADGRGLQEVQINDKFAKLSESLFIAERTARKEIEARATMMKKIQRKQKEFKEEELRALASKARKAGTARARMEERATEDYVETAQETEEDVEQRDAREELRRDRKRDMRRELRMENMADDKKATALAKRDRERDVSESIALGKAVPKSKDSMFDQRLFNQSEGMSAGFGDEASYGVYDKPLFNQNKSNYIYRNKGAENATTEEELASMIEKSTNKFKPDRGFDGAEKSSAATSNRDKPVEFEKDEADPFGLGQLLDDAKKGRETLDKIGSRGHMSAAGGSTKSREEYKSGDRDREKRGGERREREFEEGEGRKKRRR